MCLDKILSVGEKGAQRGFVVAQRQTDPPEPGRAEARPPPSEEPAMHPDATAGSAEGKTRPGSWHLALASAKLFPHKWPLVPVQRRG